MPCLTNSSHSNYTTLLKMQSSRPSNVFLKHDKKRHVKTAKYTDPKLASPLRGQASYNSYNYIARACIYCKYKHSLLLFHYGDIGQTKALIRLEIGHLSARPKLTNNWPTLSQVTCCSFNPGLFLHSSENFRARILTAGVSRSFGRLAPRGLGVHFEGRPFREMPSPSIRCQSPHFSIFKHPMSVDLPNSLQIGIPKGV